MCSLMRRFMVLCQVVLSLGLFFGLTTYCGAYSVLTHEEVVDLLWKDDIQPLLLKRFPGASAEDLKKAHAFAYGGCLVQDMGYYPFGNKYFSDLTHYVRSGDFIANMINEATDLDEYAFALGALAHYSADNIGHPTVNQAVALEFPKLQKKFGKAVTYADNPKAHIRTEFGFDVTQVAKNRYTSDRYHDFIGFEISKPVLERAFQDTYGIPLSDVIANEDLAIGTFRRAISHILPEMTRVALVARKKELVAETPNFNSRKFRYNLSRADYQREWGKGYRRPGFGTRVLAFFLTLRSEDWAVQGARLQDSHTENRRSVYSERQPHARQLQKPAGGNQGEEAKSAQYRFRHRPNDACRRICTHRQSVRTSTEPIGGA